MGETEFSFHRRHKEAFEDAGSKTRRRFL